MSTPSPLRGGLGAPLISLGMSVFPSPLEGEGQGEGDARLRHYRGDLFLFIGDRSALGPLA